MTLTIKWVGPPRSFAEGRERQLRYVTLHYTAGSEGPTSAENGAAYDKTRTDGTSCHYFTDSLGPAVQEVHDEDTSYSAFPKGNALGIHIEICGTAQTRAQWLDATSKATLQTTAELVAYLLKKHGLPDRRLTVAETRAAWYAPIAERGKYEGYNDHGTVTRAYPEDGGTHTDLGAGFPWDVFSAMVTEAMGGDDMTDQDIAKGAWRTDGAVDNQFAWRADSPLHTPKPAKPNEQVQGQIEVANRAELARAQAASNGTMLSSLLAAASRIEAALARIEAALAGGVEVPALVGLTPEATQGVAEAVVDELNERTES
jgi:N-acetyl-anhydromuramyl-L-alanine amidase AmpD